MFSWACKTRTETTSLGCQENNLAVLNSKFRIAFTRRSFSCRQAQDTFGGRAGAPTTSFVHPYVAAGVLHCPPRCSSTTDRRSVAIMFGKTCPSTSRLPQSIALFYCLGAPTHHNTRRQRQKIELTLTHLLKT